MSKKYKFGDDDKQYFITFTVVNWIDLFIRDQYKAIILSSIRFCQQKKDLEVYAWCIMTSHVHMIIGTRGNPMQNIMRDFKRHTSEKLHEAIHCNRKESRRAWMIWMMERAGKKSNHPFQLWLPENHPVELFTNPFTHQKLDYIHNNPVKAGFVTLPEYWQYSSAIDYHGGKGLLDVIVLEPLLV